MSEAKVRGLVGDRNKVVLLMRQEWGVVVGEGKEYWQSKTVPRDERWSEVKMMRQEESELAFQARSRERSELVAPRVE